MTLEEAIKTAISYESNIRDLYKEAAETAPDPVGKKMFGMLGHDEQSHLDYLNVKLAQWQKTGQITVEQLESVVPPLENIRKGLEKLQVRMAQDDRKSEKQMLSKALKVEVETSNFYKKMVREMSGEGQALFANFLEIEERHTEAIQIQSDYLSHTGYWFGFKEFDMEG